MRPINWLHLSDFHLRESRIWSQDVVLAAMLEDIKRCVVEGMAFDFVLVTGDLAFSGQKAQYVLFEGFVDDLAVAVGLARDKIFCIPGNHDVDRERQTMCFAGTRSTLQSEAAIHSFLSSGEERETLLMRQHNFREFQERCFPTQVRDWTDDGLGYVSVFDIDDIKITIVGLNSAWLAEGGASDHLLLLLGECQVVQALEIARQANPHIVIGMAHHPFALLNEFDRLPTQRRLENDCHFFHCGHLHEPGASNIVTQSGRCLTLAAGASFESRGAHNSYTVITLDPLQAKTNVTFVRYDPTSGAFSSHSDMSYPHQIDAAVACGIGDLADVLDDYCPSVGDFSYYLAALLVGSAAEVPVLVNDSVVFGAVSLLQQQPDSELKAATLDFLTVSNAVKLLYGRKSLKEILATNGQPVAQYGTALLALSDADTHEQIGQRNDSARMLAGTDTAKPFSHTLDLLKELRNSGEWDTLRRQAERHIGLEDPFAAAHVKRMLALCLARSSEHEDLNRAVGLYQELADSPQCEAADIATLATLLSNDGNYDQAMTTVLRGIKVFPCNFEGFEEIGIRIVNVTGDRDFREQLITLKAERRVK